MDNDWLSRIATFVFLLFFGIAVYSGAVDRLNDVEKPKCTCAQAVAVEE